MSSPKVRANYRPDIDGLRAIAVLAVMLYHAGFKETGGGYIGVDVFFVISGYLITQFIDQRISAGRFSIVEFYERRVRRIVPALCFLLLCASVASVFILLPSDLVDFAKSEIATLAFFPNVLFYLHSGYFDTAAKLKPLLHMWSLGVEEQFYIFFPPLMLLVSRAGQRRARQIIWLLTATSFLVSIWTVQYRGLQESGFYLVPFRAWELLLGSLLALHCLPPIIGKVPRNVVAAIGLGAILISTILFSAGTSFPGLSAALPCVGTAMVIYADESGATLTGNLLALRPLVWVGLISYSLYLWHWPTLVLLGYLRARALTSVERAACLIFSTAAAALSWRFVEQPFREKRVGAARQTLMWQAAVGIISLGCIALLFVGQHGFVHRFPRQAALYAASMGERDQDFDKCRSAKQIEEESVCHLGFASAAAPTFLLWGDSHAAALGPAFDLVAKQSAVTGWIANSPGCLPLLDVQRVGTPGCAQFNRGILDLAKRHNIPDVIFAGRWALPSLGFTQAELDEGRAQVLLFDSSTKKLSLQENGSVFVRGIHRLLSDPAMQGRKLTLILDVPDSGVDTPRYLAHLAAVNATTGFQEVRLSESPYALQSSHVDDQLMIIARTYGASTINLKAELCKAKECLVARGGHSLYRDSHHLTIFGALQLAEILRPALGQSAHAQLVQSPFVPSQRRP